MEGLHKVTVNHTYTSMTSPSKTMPIVSSMTLKNTYNSSAFERLFLCIKKMQRLINTSILKEHFKNKIWNVVVCWTHLKTSVIQQLKTQQQINKNLLKLLSPTIQKLIIKASFTPILVYAAKRNVLNSIYTIFFFFLSFL